MWMDQQQIWMQNLWKFLPLVARPDLNNQSHMQLLSLMNQWTILLLYDAQPVEVDYDQNIGSGDGYYYMDGGFASPSSTESIDGNDNHTPPHRPGNEDLYDTVITSIQSGRSHSRAGC